MNKKQKNELKKKVKEAYSRHIQKWVDKKVANNLKLLHSNNSKYEDMI